MSIKDISKKIKLLLINNTNFLFKEIKNFLDIKQDIFIVISIILIGLIGFGLGKLSALEKNRDSVSITKGDFIILEDDSIGFIKKEINNESLLIKNDLLIKDSAKAVISTENAKGLLVASKSGKKYHFPWCAGALQIADKNKIWFSSYEEAIKAGYTPASNCPNLK